MKLKPCHICLRKVTLSNKVLGLYSILCEGDPKYDKDHDVCMFDQNKDRLIERWNTRSNYLQRGKDK